MEDNYEGLPAPVQLHQKSKPFRGRDPKPWAALDPRDNIEHTRQQKTSALSRDLLVYDDVIKTGKAPGLSLPTTLLDIEKVLRPYSNYLELLKEGKLLDDGKRKKQYICLICAIQPQGSRPIAKSKKSTKTRETPFFSEKSGLRQHLDRVHLPCLVTKAFTFLPRPCREIFGVETDLKKHDSECAKKCKSIDKPSHEALKQLREDLIKCGAMGPYELAKQQLPVLFDEVKGEPVKRYDALDKTNHLMLRPRKTTDTKPCSDPEELQALREALRVVLGGYMGRQKAREIWDEEVLENTATDPVPPSVQTETRDIAEELSLANQRNAPGPEDTTHKTPRSAHTTPRSSLSSFSRTVLDTIRDAVTVNSFSRPNTCPEAIEPAVSPEGLYDYSFSFQEPLTTDSQSAYDSGSTDWRAPAEDIDQTCIDPRLLEGAFSSQQAQLQYSLSSDTDDTSMGDSPWSPGLWQQE